MVSLQLLLLVGIFLVTLVQWAEGQVSAISATYATSYVESTASGDLAVTFTVGSGEGSGNSIVFTPTKQIFATSVTGAGSTQTGGCSTAALTCNTNAVGTRTMTCTVNSGAVTTASPCTITFSATSTTGLVSTLPSAGALALTITGTANGACPSCPSTVFQIIPAPSIINVGSQVPSAQLLSLTVSFTAPFPIQANDKIEIEPSVEIFSNVAGATAADITDNTGSPGTLGNAFQAVATTSSSPSLTGSFRSLIVEPTVNIAMGATIDFTVLQATWLEANPSSAATINFIVAMGTAGATAGVQAATFGYSVALADPMTFVNGSKVKFWIPPDRFSPLIATPDVQLLTMPIVGSTPDLQWFDHFLVLTSDGKELVKVKVKRQESTSNRTVFRRHEFNQIELRLFGNNIPEKRFQHSKMFRASGVTIGIGRDFFGRPRTHSGEMSEYVMIETNSIAFVMFASHAGTEFPDDIAMQTKYTHMDWVALEMNEEAKSSFTGILPELWGTIPMTDNVASMLIPPSEVDNPNSSAHNVCPGRVCGAPVLANPSSFSGPSRVGAVKVTMKIQ